MDDQDRTAVPSADVESRSMRGKNQHAAWSTDDIEVLRRYYANVDDADFSVSELAASLGRTEDAVSLKASRLGIAKRNRAKSLTTRRRMSNSQKVYFSCDASRQKTSLSVIRSIAEKGHPRGMLGKCHTQATKAALSALSTAAMKRMSADGMAARIIKGLKTREKNGTLCPPRNKTTWKSGWREIGGVRKYYRSKWEANYARYLQWLKEMSQIRSWEHEPETFWFESVKRGCRSYLPDFRVEENDGIVAYHEVKGWMDNRSKTKIKRMAKYYPDVRLIVIDDKAYREINKKLSSVIPGWE